MERQGRWQSCLHAEAIVCRCIPGSILAAVNVTYPQFPVLVAPMCLTRFEAFMSHEAFSNNQIYQSKISLTNKMIGNFAAL